MTTGQTASVSRRPLRSIGAVLAGLFFVIFSSTVVDLVLHGTGIFPPMGQPMTDSLWMLATAYRVVFQIAGTYFTARLAPSRPVLHAVAGGGIGLVLAGIGAAVTWERGPAFGPHWYPLGLVVSAIPCTCIGAWLNARRMA